MIARGVIEFCDGGPPVRTKLTHIVFYFTSLNTHHTAKLLVYTVSVS